MSMEKFCEEIGVPNAGKKAKMNSQPTELRTLFTPVCNQDTKDLQRQKISSMLFPHLRYFAYFIARGVLARNNTSNISAPNIVILANALSGESKYNVGALIARRLAANTTREISLVDFMPHLFSSLLSAPHILMMCLFLL